MSAAHPIRVAMWSGPRNISTALMRGWENRPDTHVSDEPLYAHYLKARPEIDHPAREQIIVSCDTDWRSVAAHLTGPVPAGKTVWYQKHMSHHLLPEIDLSRLSGLINCFLIRDPAEVITSFIKIVPNPDTADLGLPQQVQLFNRERDRLGHAPPVIDAADVLRDPRTLLSALCASLGIPFLDAMLSWSPGPRATDGVWAPHWYASVEKSTGFEPYTPKHEPVPPRLAGVHRECRRLYDQLAPFRLRL